MDNGLYSLNEERIRELICKYENVDTKNIKDYYDIRKYKMDQCELKLRLILKKYYNGKKITYPAFLVVKDNYVIAYQMKDANSLTIRDIEKLIQASGVVK